MRRRLRRRLRRRMKRKRGRTRAQVVSKLQFRQMNDTTDIYDDNSQAIQVETRQAVGVVR